MCETGRGIGSQKTQQKVQKAGEWRAGYCIHKDSEDTKLSQGVRGEVEREYDSVCVCVVLCVCVLIQVYEKGERR